MPDEERRPQRESCRVLIFWESHVPVKSEKADSGRCLSSAANPGNPVASRFNAFFHWLLDGFLVLCLVHEEPVPVVVPLWMPQEAKSGFRK